MSGRQMNWAMMCAGLGAWGEYMGQAVDMVYGRTYGIKPNGPADRKARKERARMLTRQREAEIAAAKEGLKKVKEPKRVWKAHKKEAVLYVDGIPSGYSEPCATHEAAVRVAERLNEEDEDE